MVDKVDKARIPPRDRAEDHPPSAGRNTRQREKPQDLAEQEPDDTIEGQGSPGLDISGGGGHA